MGQVQKILVMGLPGSGKTTLAQALAPKLGAVWFNADAVRLNINRDLGFTIEDRIEHARRMGWLCEQVAAAGHVAIADFVCPTHETRRAFGEAFLIWMDRIEEGRFLDTNRLFTPPARWDFRIGADGMPEEWATRIAGHLQRPAGSTGPGLAHRPEMQGATAPPTRQGRERSA